MSTHTRDAVLALLAEHNARMAVLIADKPTVIDSHSDGKRVKYVRSETAVAILRDVLALIDGNAS